MSLLDNLVNIATDCVKGNEGEVSLKETYNSSSNDNHNKKKHINNQSNTK